MDTKQLDTYTPDYCSYMFWADYDLAQVRIGIWELHIQTTLKNLKLDDDGGHRTRVVAARPDGKRQYVLHAWGTHAWVFYSLTAPDWVAQLTRVDFKQAIDAEEEDIKAVGRAVEDSKPQWAYDGYTRPARQKLDGKDAGGTGWKLGSKKSDVVITTYKKPRSDAQWEVQAKGAWLARRIATAVEVIKTTGDVTGALDGIKAEAVAEGQRRYCIALENAGVGTYWPDASAWADQDAVPACELQALGQHPGFDAEVEPWEEYSPDQHTHPEGIW